MSNRAPSVNRVMLGGNVVKDAEVHHVGENLTSITRITVANNQSFKDKEGKWQELTTYVDVEVWGNTAEKVAEKGKKGVPVLIEGYLRQSRWDDKEGKPHTRTFVRADRVYFL